MSPSLPIHSLSKLGLADPAAVKAGGKGEYDFIIVSLPESLICLVRPDESPKPFLGFQDGRDRSMIQANLR